MGSAGSKATRAAAGTTARRYPSRPSPATQATPASAPSAPSRSPDPTANIGPTLHSNEGPSDVRDQSINIDASDPVLASKLREIGPVASNPYQSHTSTQYNQSRRKTPPNNLPGEFAPFGNEPPPGLFPDPATMRNNPALLVMQARERWQQKAEFEMDNIGRKGFEGRELMDVGMITDALKMRERGIPPADIEKRLNLKKGLMAKLGPKGVVEPGYS